MTARATNLWPISITAVYGLFFCAMVGFVVFAVRHPTELVSKDYYKQELAFQQRIDSETRARLDPEAPSIDTDQPGRAWVIHFPGTAPEAGSITLYRPSDSTLDRTLPLKLDGQAQRIDTASLHPGLWRVRLEWMRDHQSYFREQVILLD